MHKTNKKRKDYPEESSPKEKKTQKNLVFPEDLPIQTKKEFDLWISGWSNRDLQFISKWIAYRQGNSKLNNTLLLKCKDKKQAVSTIKKSDEFAQCLMDALAATPLLHMFHSSVDRTQVRLPYQKVRRIAKYDTKTLNRWAVEIGDSEFGAVKMTGTGTGMNRQEFFLCYQHMLVTQVFLIPT